MKCKLARYLLSVIFLNAFLLGCNGNSQTTTATETGSASYQLTFRSTWAEMTHPDNFPANPHFSGLIGATHNINVKLWQVGAIASNGIENMAEAGSKTVLSDEIQHQIDIGDAAIIISEGGLSTSPSETTITFDVNTEYSFLTLVSMLAPSPDWFVGVTALNLLENGVWVESMTIDLNVYDAGTDDGFIYTSPDHDSSPKQSISMITSSPFLVGSDIIPVGQFIISRISL